SRRKSRWLSMRCSTTSTPDHPGQGLAAVSACGSARSSSRISGVFLRSKTEAASRGRGMSPPCHRVAEPSVNPCRQALIMWPPAGGMGIDMSGLLVAIGDSFTEGVGDPHLHYPNGVRGWADRLARQLGRADPSWRYANLAIRSKFLDQVVAEQLEPAIAMGPSHISFNAGGNDLLSLRADVDSIARRYEVALARLNATDARVIFVTTFEPRTSRLVQPLV